MRKTLCGRTPWASPGLIDGKFTFINGQTQEQNNPLYSLSMRNDYNLNNNSTLNSAVRLTHKLDFITPGLSANIRGSYDSYFSSTASGKSFPVYYTVRPNPNGDKLNPIWEQKNNEQPSLRRNNNYSDKWRTWYAEFAMNYNRTFGDHNVTGLVMGNLSKKFDPDLEYNLPHAYQSLVGRITYAYKGKYLAEYNMGYNGSENFPEGKRFGFFPAYSLGWVATKEDFWPENDYVTFLKVRGSMGKVGNDQLGTPSGGFYRFMYLPDVWSYSGVIVWAVYYFGQYGSNR